MHPLIRRIWSLLTQPSPLVINASDRRHAQSLATFILMALCTAPFVVLLKFDALPEFQPAKPFILFLVPPTFVAYVLSRTRYYRAGMLLEAILIWSGVVATYWVRPGDLVSICFLVIPVLFSAAIFDRRTTFTICGLTVVTDLALVFLTPVGERVELVGAQTFLVFSIGLVLYNERNKALLEISRGEALEAAVANHKELLSATFDGVALHDFGRIMEADSGFAALFGLQADEIIFNPVQSLFQPEEERRLERLISESTGRPSEFRIQHVADQVRWIEMVCQSERDALGERVEILAARDVTERKALEQQVLVAGRMVAMGTIAAGVAHEINNPLTYIMGHQALLRRELKKILANADPTEQETVSHRLQIINEGVERVKHIVSDLRTFSRIEDEEISIVDLEEVAETAIQMTWNQIRHRGTLIRDFSPAPPVEANPAHLGQVVINLLINAAQALPESANEESHITIGIEPNDGGRVRLWVSDTGPGIPEKRLRRIFEPFFTTKPIGQGTGLGLSICHSLVQRYNGTISVRSSSQGTTFDVLFPGSEQPLPSKPVPEPETSTPSLQRHIRILVVDDEPEIAGLLEQLFFEFEVKLAGNGEQALELWKRLDFDVVICDLMMPRVSGKDLYHLIRAEKPGAERRMIFITGGAFTPATKAFLENLEQPWLQKPFAPIQLKSLALDMVRGLPPLVDGAESD